MRCGHAVTFCFISGGLIPLVVSLLEIIRNNMFAAVTFATVSHWGLLQILCIELLPISAAFSSMSMRLHCVIFQVCRNVMLVCLVMI